MNTATPKPLAKPPAQARLPYGISNFEALIAKGYVYIDKTRFIERLENESNPYQLFIRPRKFGKSLFFTTLFYYYDVNYAEKFQTLFKGLYIGEHPTPEHNRFMMLKFDFSGLNTNSAEEFKASFYDEIRKTLLDFIETYRHLFRNTDNLMKELTQTPQSTGALQTIFSAVNSIGAKLFVLIDEYDHFANDLIALGAHGRSVYHNMVQANGLVRDFYEKLKNGTKSVVSRIFITGISPVMMNDLTSGFNIADNLTLEERYNEMLGFTQDEVDTLIDATGIDRKLITIDLAHYYNGYLFSEDAETRLYNPNMALYFLNKILMTGRIPKHIIDDNLRTDYARLRRLIENEHNRKTLIAIMKNNGIMAEIARSFSMDEMYREQYFVSLLFYMGLITIDRLERGMTVLRIPNYSIRTLYWEYLEQLTGNLNSEIMVDMSVEGAAIRNLAYDGDLGPYLDYMSKNIFQRLSNRDLLGFDEKYIKLMLLGGLFRSRLYVPDSEKEVEHGYIDIFLQRSPLVPDVAYEWVWELKYLKKEDAAEAKVSAMLEAAQGQLAKYRQSALFAGRDDVKFAALLFIGKEQYQIV
jgi:hypothetical protein